MTVRYLQRFGLTIILLMAVSLTFVEAQIDTLHWNATRGLSLGDLKGDPISDIGMNGEILCMIAANFEKPNSFQKTRFVVVAYLDRAKSWVNPESKNEATLLYFKTMFDIYELQARRLRKDLAETKFGSNPTDLFNQKYTKIMEGLSEELNNYRRETKMSRDTVKVREWSDKLQKQLMELEMFSK